VLAFEPPPIEGLSMTGGFDGFVQSRGGGDYKQLEAAVQKLVAAANQRPELAGVTTSYSASVPQVRIDLDREKAKLLGVNVAEVFETLQSTFGALYVNDFNRSGRVFRVHLQSEAEFRAHPDDIRNVYVRTGSGELIPLTALVTIREVTGPESIERYNVFPSAKILGGPAPGYSSGQALAVMEQVAKEALPDGYALEWTGTSFQEKATGGASQTVFLVGVLMVLLVLAAQYERWTLPFAVILAVPFAVFGAFLAVFLRGLENDIYFQIGLVTLVGLASKNAILIVEFAQLKVQEGMSVVDAAIEGAKLRFRPIVMTSLAFILGVTPLAVSSGAGAASRHSIGTGVIGGMLAATFVATFFVPVFFRWVAGWGRRPAASVTTQE
jgi:HAE1 family hydrophobic/amphiphilic exporter-1/multidrug efflux pump